MHYLRVLFYSTGVDVMNSEEAAIANIDNLTELWKLMGSKACLIEGGRQVHISDGWPYRCWHDPQQHHHNQKSSCDISKLENSYTVPVWNLDNSDTKPLRIILAESGFGIATEQLAMYLDLDNHYFFKQPEFVLRNVHSEQEINTWIRTAERAFGYSINSAVIHRIAKQEEVNLYMAFINKQPAATAKIYKTGKVMGIHQLGVVPEFRRRGLAKKIMQNLIWIGSNTRCRVITLQASSEAKELYSDAGFKYQFSIFNYRKIRERCKCCC